MCRRCVRGMLLGLGCLLILFAVLPVLAFLHLGDAWEMGLMASKLIMLPLGAVCLLIGAAMGTARVPR